MFSSCIYVSAHAPVCVYVHHVCVVPMEFERGQHRILDLKPQVVVNLHVGAWKQTQIPCKNSKSSYPPSHLSTVMRLKQFCSTGLNGPQHADRNRRSRVGQHSASPLSTENFRTLKMSFQKRRFMRLKFLPEEVTGCGFVDDRPTDYVRQPICGSYFLTHVFRSSGSLHQVLTGCMEKSLACLPFFGPNFCSLGITDFTLHTDKSGTRCQRTAHNIDEEQLIRVRKTYGNIEFYINL